MEFQPLDRYYSNYMWKGDGDPPTIDPVASKLLVGDMVFNNGIALTSEWRNKTIAGILQYSGSTFGRLKDKLVYKCIPNNRYLPTFLVPFAEKSQMLSKNKVDHFVQFKFDKWDGKHPTGILTHTLGSVNDLDVYTEYQLICRNASHPIQKFTRQAFNAVRKIGKESDLLSDKLTKKWPSIEDRTDERVISIDPDGCVDIDDAFSVTDDRLSVYIANVPVIMEYLGIWDDYAERVTTIYLPDRKRPMLPAILSEELCSLREGRKRAAIHMDIDLDSGNTTMGCSIISNNRAYAYESSDLEEDDTYQAAKRYVTDWNSQTTYVHEAIDSHTLIQYLMVRMNHMVGKELLCRGGIFRSYKGNSTSTENVPDTRLASFLKYWGSKSGSYTLDTTDVKHDAMPSTVTVYCHSTSPIRRLVDLINCTMLVENCSVSLPGSRSFVELWKSRIDYINDQGVAVRRVQNEVAALHYCESVDDTCRKHDGFVIENKQLKDSWDNLVYMPGPGIISCCKSDVSLPINQCLQFDIYTFSDDTTLRKKVRLALVE